MTPAIPGADTVAAWFGHWPSFHDAEVVTLHIDRESKQSFMRIRTFTMSERTDSAGYFLRDRDALLRFDFSGIQLMRIEAEHADVQNVIHGMTIEKVDEGYRLVLAPCYGLAGEIEVTTLSVRIESTFDHLADLPKQPD